MRLSVCKEFTFASAHKLPGYSGPCANLHGHEWKLEVEVSGDVDPNSGMVLDFVELKRIVKDEIIDRLDHSYLNDTFSNPTAENMVDWMCRTMQAELMLFTVELERIRLYETPTSFCEWRRSCCNP